MGQRYSPKLIECCVGGKRTQTQEIPIRKAGLGSEVQHKIPIKDGFRITTTLSYDKINNVYDSKSVRVPLLTSVVKDLCDAGQAGDAGIR